MLNKELEFTLNLAYKETRDKKHEFMTVEHLLLALLDNPEASAVLLACSAKVVATSAAAASPPSRSSRAALGVSVCSLTAWNAINRLSTPRSSRTFRTS